MSRTRWVLLDDADSSIQYNGPWFLHEDSFSTYGTYGPPYRGSQHGVNGTASFSFSYLGSRVRVLGTSAVHNSSGVTDPTWDCRLDNVSFGSEDPWTSPINNWPLCESPAEPEGQHTLTVNVTSTTGTTFWVDQVRFLPSESAKSSLVHPVVFIEQTDPSISYISGSWQPLQTNAMMTLQAGSTMNVNFTGTKATWIGWRPSGYPAGASTGTYSIDGELPVPFTLNGISPGASSLYDQVIFETDTLSAGAHSLTVVHQGPAAPLTLDYLLVADGDIMYPSTTNAPVISDVPLPSPSSSSSPSPSNSVTPAGATAAPVGAIVGGVVGGIALIVIFVLAFFFIRKRSRARDGPHLDTSSAFTQGGLPPQDGFPQQSGFPQQGLAQQALEVTPFIMPSQPTPTTASFSTQPYAPLLSSTSGYPSGPVPMSGYQPVPAWSASSYGVVNSNTTSSDDMSNVPHQSATLPPQTSRDQKLSPLRRNPQELYSSALPSSGLTHAHSDSSSVSGGSNVPQAFTPFQEPALVQHLDSGIRLPARPVVDVPPLYTPE